MFQIIDAISVPCENKLAGCKAIMNLNEKEDHMKNCEFRSLACKIGRYIHNEFRVNSYLTSLYYMKLQL